jgi:hypothetical protein
MSGRDTRISLQLPAVGGFIVCKVAGLLRSFGTIDH